MRSLLKYIASVVTCAFVCASFDFTAARAAYASELSLPVPTQMVQASSAFSYPVLKGLKIDPQDPLNLEFIIDTQDKSDVNEAEAQKLVNYFLAAVAVPQKDLWVNLSPYEKDRVVTDELGQTVLGEELLAQDYLLKQLSSSLTDPNTDLGKSYWNKVASASSATGSAETLKKIWIKPALAEVYEKGTQVFVTKATLDVESEASASSATELLLPAIRKEVNEGEHFAPIRQAYYSIILGLWFKEKLRSSIFKDYIDAKRVNGIAQSAPQSKEEIFNAYVESFKKGVYNQTAKTHENGKLVKRAYFSGGFGVPAKFSVSHTSSSLSAKVGRAAFVLKVAVRSVVRKLTTVGANDFVDLSEEGLPPGQRALYTRWRELAQVNESLSVLPLTDALIFRDRLARAKTAPKGMRWKIEHQVLLDLKQYLSPDHGLASSKIEGNAYVCISNVELNRSTISKNTSADKLFFVVGRDHGDSFSVAERLQRDIYVFSDASTEAELVAYGLSLVSSYSRKRFATVINADGSRAEHSVVDILLHGVNYGGREVILSDNDRLLQMLKSKEIRSFMSSFADAVLSDPMVFSSIPSDLLAENVVRYAKEDMTISLGDISEVIAKIRKVVAEEYLHDRLGVSADVKRVIGGRFSNFLNRLWPHEVDVDKKLTVVGKLKSLHYLITQNDVDISEIQQAVKEMYSDIESTFKNAPYEDAVRYYRMLRSNVSVFNLISRDKNMSYVSVGRFFTQDSDLKHVFPKSSNLPQILSVVADKSSSVEEYLPGIGAGYKKLDHVVVVRPQDGDPAIFSGSIGTCFPEAVLVSYNVAEARMAAYQKMQKSAPHRSDITDLLSEVIRLHAEESRRVGSVHFNDLYVNQVMAHELMHAITPDMHDFSAGRHISSRRRFVSEALARLHEYRYLTSKHLSLATVHMDNLFGIFSMPWCRMIVKQVYGVKTVQEATQWLRDYRKADGKTRAEIDKKIAEKAEAMFARVDAEWKRLVKDRDAYVPDETLFSDAVNVVSSAVTEEPADDVVMPGDEFRESDIGDSPDRVESVSPESVDPAARREFDRLVPKAFTFYRAHGENVSAMARLLAKKMGLTPAAQNIAARIGLFHDVGLMMFPEMDTEHFTAVRKGLVRDTDAIAALQKKVAKEQRRRYESDVSVPWDFVADDLIVSPADIDAVRPSAEGLSAWIPGKDDRRALTAEFVDHAWAGAKRVLDDGFPLSNAEIFIIENHMSGYNTGDDAFWTALGRTASISGDELKTLLDLFVAADVCDRGNNVPMRIWKNYDPKPEEMAETLAFLRKKNINDSRVFDLLRQLDEGHDSEYKNLISRMRLGGDVGDRLTGMRELQNTVAGLRKSFSRHTPEIIERKRKVGNSHVDLVADVATYVMTNDRISLRKHLEKMLEKRVSPLVSQVDEIEKYDSLVDMITADFADLSKENQRILMAAIVYHDVGATIGSRDFTHDRAGGARIRGELRGEFEGQGFSDFEIEEIAKIVDHHGFVANWESAYTYGDKDMFSNIELHMLRILGFCDSMGRADYMPDLGGVAQSLKLARFSESSEAYLKRRIDEAGFPWVFPITSEDRKNNLWHSDFLNSPTRREIFTAKFRNQLCSLFAMMFDRAKNTEGDGAALYVSFMNAIADEIDRTCDLAKVKSITLDTSAYDFMGAQEKTAPFRAFAEHLRRGDMRFRVVPDVSGEHVTLVIADEMFASSPSSVEGGVDMKKISIESAAGSSAIKLNTTGIDQAMFNDGLSFTITSLTKVSSEAVLAGLR